MVEVVVAKVEEEVSSREEAMVSYPNAREYQTRVVVMADLRFRESMERIVWTDGMVPVEERSIVEGLIWECSRVDSARFLVT
ncbi:hypothetical protein Tco_0368932 [Tanacetum coccineum]